MTGKRTQIMERLMRAMRLVDKKTLGTMTRRRKHRISTWRMAQAI